MITRKAPFERELAAAGADTSLRHSMAAAIESVRSEDQMPLALYFMVAGMEMLAANALVPKQREICMAYADACRGFIPERIIVLAGAVKGGKAKLK